jgi:hypothetical protein
MKNILSILLVSLVLVSCSESIPYEKQVVEELRQQMKNPDSFRLDSIKYTPKFLSDQLEVDIEFDSAMIDTKTEMKDFYQEMIDSYKNLSYMGDLVVGYKNNLREYQTKIDSIQDRKVKSEKFLSEVKGTDKDTLVLHTYRAYYMAQNSFGAMIKGSAYMATSDGKKIYVRAEND